jgi:hypothetical protein
MSRAISFWRQGGSWVNASRGAAWRPAGSLLSARGLSVGDVLGVTDVPGGVGLRAACGTQSHLVPAGYGFGARVTRPVSGVLSRTGPVSWSRVGLGAKAPAALVP